MNKTIEKLNDYESFVKKFEKKKTTDDCYTPPLIYEAVANHVAKKYNLDRANFVRPFYPGGDYENLNQYNKETVVVDNPPFSILAQILDFYLQNNIKFFLFAPSLTMITTLGRRKATAVFTHNSIIYENGAVVNTSFLTNLEPEDVQAITDPELRRAVKKAMREIKDAKTLPKYKYPDELMTQNTFRYLVICDVPYKLYRSEARKIAALDSQRPAKKAIYGGGYLIGSQAQERLAEAKVQAENYTGDDHPQKRNVWELSEKEKGIIAEIDKENDHGR